MEKVRLKRKLLPTEFMTLSSVTDDFPQSRQDRLPIKSVGDNFRPNKILFSHKKLEKVIIES
jgi:hypothetical protein